MDVFSYVQFAMKIVTKMFLINSTNKRLQVMMGLPVMIWSKIEKLIHHFSDIRYFYQ
jgi:hypothetical protein